MGSLQPSLERAGATPVLFQAADLKAGYGPKEVLHGLKFSIQSRRTTVILGPGGSGKTTLIRILSGAESDYSIWRTGDIQCALADSCCWMQQYTKPVPDTVRELFRRYHDQYLRQLLLLSGSTPAGGASQAPPAGFEAAFEAFLTAIEATPCHGSELVRYLECPLEKMPKVLAQLLHFCMLLFWRCPAMIFDEPDADLDPALHGWMIDQLQQLHGTCGILLATHNINIARSVADFAILLIDGEICEAAEASLFFTSPRKARTQYFIRMGS